MCDVVTFFQNALGGRCSSDSDPLLDGEVRFFSIWITITNLSDSNLFVSCSKLTRDNHVITAMILVKHSCDFVWLRLVYLLRSYSVGSQSSSETSIAFRHFKTLQYRYNVSEGRRVHIGAFIRGATNRLIALRASHLPC